MNKLKCAVKMKQMPKLVTTNLASPKMHLFEKKVIHPNETASALDSIQLAEA
jgi:hypothetical protein